MVFDKILFFSVAMNHYILNESCDAKPLMLYTKVFALKYALIIVVQFLNNFRITYLQLELSVCLALSK